MQEFALLFSEGLRRGLRRFALSTQEEQLVECYNLMPDIEGLIPHERVRDIGFSFSYFEYIRLLDQADIEHYWCAGPDGALTVLTTVETELQGRHSVDVTPSNIYWLELEDESSVVWYLWPDDITAQPILTSEPPPVGSGISVITFRGVDALVWTYAVDSIIPTYYPVEV
jgi:hypothetical protein